MDLFSYILILTSVIYALAIAQILEGVSRLPQSSATIRASFHLAAEPFRFHFSGLVGHPGVSRHRMVVSKICLHADRANGLVLHLFAVAAARPGRSGHQSGNAFLPDKAPLLRFVFHRRIRRHDRWQCTCGRADLAQWPYRPRGDSRCRCGGIPESCEAVAARRSNNHAGQHVGPGGYPISPASMSTVDENRSAVNVVSATDPHFSRRDLADYRTSGLVIRAPSEIGPITTIVRETLCRVERMAKTISGGLVHELPADLSIALTGNKEVLGRWESLTPIARNEFICWVEDAKQEKTRVRRISRTVEELLVRSKTLVLLGGMHSSHRQEAEKIVGSFLDNFRNALVTVQVSKK